MKQSYCTGETGVQIVSERPQDVGLYFSALEPFELMYHFYSFCTVKNNSECVPFEESLTQPQEEEPAKSLLEVRLRILLDTGAAAVSCFYNPGFLHFSSSCCGVLGRGFAYSGN